MMRKQHVPEKRFWIYILGIVIAGIGAGLWFLAIGIPPQKAFWGNPIFWAAISLAFILSLARVAQSKKNAESKNDSQDF